MGFKSPEGGGKETIVQNVSKARKQSPKVISDMHRTPLSVREVLRKVDQALAR